MSYRRWKRLGPRSRPGPRVALFPFLAVLICTMGALVPLLLAMAHQARLSAQAEAQTRAADRINELNAECEAVMWRIEQLRTARRQTEAQWERAQQYLGHLEDHSRRLEEEIGQLRRQFESLQQKRQRDGAGLDALRAQCRQLDDELARAEAEAALPRAEKKQRSYALVPYVGPNRTQRRPIYLECTARAVVVQPEGIRLTAEDFEGPLGASNPLVSVVRAAREQLVLSGALDPDRDGEPYPLLLVRPDGVAAYHYARIALKPWGTDFGYELISAELALAYPPPDARLAEVMQTALAQARQVQARLIAAAPRSYGNLRRTQSAASDDELGRVAGAGRSERSADGTAFGIGAAPDLPPGRPTGGHGSRSSDATAFGRGDPAEAGLAGPTGMIGTSGAAGRTGPGAAMVGSVGAAGDPAGAGEAGLPGGSFDGAVGASERSIAGDSAAAAGVPIGTGAAGQRHRPSAVSRSTGGTTNGPTRDASGQEFVAAGQHSAQPQSGLNPPVPSGQAGAAGLLPGEWQEKPPGARAAEAEGAAQLGQAERHPSGGRSRNRPDWALPEAGPRSTGIVRPIRVELYADRMVVGSGSNATTIVLPARTAAVADELVAAVRAQMESWGIAGKSAHWRPVLAVDVAPGADGRYAELARMLEGSGVGVERRAAARVEGRSLR